MHIFRDFLCNRHLVPCQLAMPSWPWTDHPCPRTSRQVIIIMWLANTARWHSSSQKKLYLVMDLLFRSHGWLKTIFCNEHGRACWRPGCPKPWACQMVAACFLAELLSHPEVPGALGPVSLLQAAWVAYSSLLYKHYHFLRTSWCEKLLRHTGVRWPYWITRGHARGAGSPSMLCWGCTCPRKEGHLCDWVVGELSPSHWPSPLRDNPVGLNTWE